MFVHKVNKSVSFKKLEDLPNLPGAFGAALSAYSSGPSKTREMAGGLQRKREIKPTTLLREFLPISSLFLTLARSEYPSGEVSSSSVIM